VVADNSASWLPKVFQDRHIDQIGIVVPDLDEALPFYAEMFAVDVWNIYTYDDAIVPFREFRGSPGQFSMMLALGGSSPQIELIEPICGPSLYHEWIEERGYGLHHLGVFVPSVDEVITEMRGHGIAVLQRGSGYGLDGDGAFAYFATDDHLSTYIEAIEIPERRRPPEREFRRADR
jgi:methylmalonyl-CoA/ethylmalonyl-CoA epimerase